MSNTYGRQVVIPMTNKSGGGVVAGDVVIVDTSNDTAFTTTTSAAFTGGVGVAQETIANNAIGRVLIEGYAALVNVSASVTRGQYGATHTVAKQAAGTASRGTGTFAQWLTGGTTPTARIFPVDLLGSSLTNPMSAVGDIIQGTTAGAPARLAAPLAGKVLTGAGVTTTLAYNYPPGYEYDYVAKTSDTNITATSEGTANTIVTGNAITYDGSTVILIHAWFWTVYLPNFSTSLTFVLYDGSSSIGKIASIFSGAAGGDMSQVISVFHRLTPSAAAKTYSIRAYVGGAYTGVVQAGAGGSGNAMPGFIRQIKVSGGA